MGYKWFAKETVGNERGDIIPVTVGRVDSKKVFDAATIWGDKINDMIMDQDKDVEA